MDTLSEGKKVLAPQQSQLLINEYERFKGLTFAEFWYAIGAPLKNDLPQPIFPYESELLALLAQFRQIWIKKARGLGITEFMLRFMAWLCLKDDKMRGAQMAIITGPRLNLAVDLIDRIKGFFGGKHRFDMEKTVVWLNGCKIQAYPSDANTSRGQPNMQVILLEEADYFDPRDQKIAREVAEGYLAKSNPYIIMVSTPNNPGGLYQTIENEPNSIYHKVFLPYTAGVDLIYNKEDLEIARKSPSFEREYNLQYGAGIGNIFPYDLLEKCIADYPLQLGGGYKALAVDPAYGSSKFGIVGGEKIDGIIYIKEATQFERASPSAMLERVVIQAKEYRNVSVDSAHPGVITDLRDKGVSATAVQFNKTLSDMTIKASEVVKTGKVRIHPTFTSLVEQLRAITFNERGHPDKKRLTFDLGDSFLMAIYALDSGSVGYAWLDSD